MKVSHTAGGAASIMDKLNLQRRHVHFCDCVIRKGQGQVYPVHKCVLAASSPVLATLLYTSGVLVELAMPCLSDPILGLLLDYIYTGALPHLENTQYSYLLSAAQYLEMDDLEAALRTKIGHMPGYYNIPDATTNLKVFPHGTVSTNAPPDSPPSGLTSDSPQNKTHRTPLSSDGSKYFTFTLETSRDRDTTNNLSAAALKLGIGQESTESDASPCSTESQEDGQIQDDETNCFGFQGNAEAEEMIPISEVQSHNTYCLSTSVIRHSSRVTRTHESAKPCPDTDAFSTKTKSHSDSAEDRNVDSPLPDPYSAQHFNQIQNDMTDNYNPFETERDNSELLTFSQTQGMPRLTINTTPHVEDEHDVNPLAEPTSDFQVKRMCGKRKQTEEPIDKCNKSAKTDLVYSAETAAGSSSLYNREPDPACRNKNTPNSALSRRSGGSPFQVQCVGLTPSYSGQLLCRCESQTGGSYFETDFSPNSLVSQDNNVTVVSNLRNENAALSEGSVILLDISSKSSEMLVSYRQTSETAARQRGEAEGGHGDCVHNSVSPSASRHKLPPGTQTDVSGPLSPPAQHAFQCSLCERSFSQRGSLNRHVRSHLGVRPFPCPHCPMTFSRQYRVMEHMRVHQRCALGVDFPKPPASSV